MADYSPWAVAGAVHGGAILDATCDASSARPLDGSALKMGSSPGSRFSGRVPDRPFSCKPKYARYVLLSY